MAFGGTLYQDIAEQKPGSLPHVNRAHYERNLHPVQIVPGTRLAELYPGLTSSRINSIHHQAIKDLAPTFTAEAHCPEDGIVEAVRWRGKSFVAGVQWHPEFHPRGGGDASIFDDSPLLQDFLHTARSLRRDATT